MLICTKDEARSIYAEIRDKVVEYAANDINLPRSSSVYREFRYSRCKTWQDLGQGAFRYGFRIKNMVAKVPYSYQGARQNLIEYYTAMAQLPFTPKGCRLALIKFQGYDIPVILVPYQDLAARDSHRSMWHDHLSHYNYTGDWAQFGRVGSRFYLTDWALLKGDVNALNGGSNSNGASTPESDSNNFSCGCCATCEGEECTRCGSIHCGQCSVATCSKSNCSNNVCGDCTCDHCTNTECSTTRCNGCHTEETTDD